MFKSALAILKVIKNDIQATSEIEEINNVFEDTTRHLNDYSTLIYYLVLRKFSFDDIFIEKNRLSLQKTIIENIVKNNENKVNKDEKRKASYVKSDIECYPDWPLCIYDLDYKYNVINYLCYKIQYIPIIIDNYFFEHNSKQNKIRKKSKSSQYKTYANKKKSHKLNKSFDNYIDSKEEINEQYETYKNLLIERRKHYCEIDSADEFKNSIEYESPNDMRLLSKDFSIFVLKKKNLIHIGVVLKQKFPFQIKKL